VKYLLTILLLSTFTAKATIYHVAANGTFNGSGSVASPINADQVNYNPFFKFGPNDSILLNRGDVFPPLVMYSSGNASSGIYIGSYGTGAKPIITSMRSFPKWANTSSWTQISTNVWRLKLDTLLAYTPRVWLNGNEYLRAKDSTQVSATKRTCWRNADFQFEYIYSVGNPATYYTSISTANTVTSVFDISGANYLTLENLDIRGGQGATVEMTEQHDVVIRNCNIGLESNRQGIRIGYSYKISIANNIFDTGERNKQDFFSTSDGGGDAIDASFGTHDADIGYNTFESWKHSAWAVEQYGLTDHDSLTNIRVHHNNVSGRYIDYGHGFVAYATEARNIVIDSNYIHNIPVQIQIACNGLRVSDNIIDTVTNIPYDSTDAPTGIGIVMGHSHFPATNMQILRNTIKNCETAGIALVGAINNDGTYADVQHNTIAYNNFEHNGYHVQQFYWTVHNLTDMNFYSGNADIRIMDNLDVLANTFTNNIFHRTDIETPVYYGHDLANNYLKTVAQFNLLDGTAGDAMSNNSLYVAQVVNNTGYITTSRRIVLVPTASASNDTPPSYNVMTAGGFILVDGSGNTIITH
jgi:hypothetical protein